MGLRLRKLFKLTSGLKLNVSKKGISISLSKKGLSLNTGTNGTFLNVGISGTGISYHTKIFKKGRRTSTVTHHKKKNNGLMEGRIMLGIIIGAVTFLVSGSFLLSFILVFIIPILLAFQKETQETPIQIKVEDNTRYLKRKEHVQQQLKREVIIQEVPVKEEEKLLQLLEVDKSLIK